MVNNQKNSILNQDLQPEAETRFSNETHKGSGKAGLCQKTYGDRLSL